MKAPCPLLKGPKHENARLIMLGAGVRVCVMSGAFIIRVHSIELILSVAVSAPIASLLTSKNQCLPVSLWH